MYNSGIARTLLPLLMASLLTVSLVGCGGSKSSRSEDDQDRSTQEQPEPSDQGQVNEEQPGEQPDPVNPDDPDDQAEPLTYPSLQFIETDAGPMGPGRIVDSTVRFVGTANPNDSILLVLNGSPSGSVLANAQGEWILDFTRIELLPGEYRVDVRAVSSTGDTLESQQPFIFTFDPSLPESPQIVGISNDTGRLGDGITSDPNQILSGTSVAGYLIKVFADGALLGETSAGTQGNWQFDLGNAAALPSDGVYNLSAVSVDFGLESPTSEVFRLTLDKTAPVQISLQPSPNSSGVSRDLDLLIEFNEPVLPAAGQIILRRAVDDELVTSIDVAGLDIGITGSTQVALPVSTLLSFATGYYVEVPAGAFQDVAGNFTPAIQGPGGWAFNVEQSSLPPINIASLTPQQGFLFTGTAPSAESTVAGVGDINGDGYEDFAVSDPAYESGRGAVYLILGRNGLTRANIVAADWSAAEGVLIVGAAVGDQLGKAMSGVGDMNGDGIVDFMIAAPGSDLGATDAGAVYVFWGKSSLSNIDLGDFASDDGFVIVAREAGQGLGDAALPALGLPLNGQALSGVGDFNGDGYSDLVLGHPQSDSAANDSGRAYVILGRAGLARSQVDLGLMGADGFSVSAPGQVNWQLGYSVLLAADINRDGFDDLVLSAPAANVGANEGGAVFVVYGRAGSNPVDVDVTALTASTGARWQSDEAGSLLGLSLGAGEFNGDGVADLYLGQPGHAVDGIANAGAVRVLFGGKSWNAINTVDALSGDQGFTLSGIGLDDFTGQSVASAGDINADGLDDVILSAFNGEYGGQRSGLAWIVLGSDDDVIDSWSLQDFLASDGIPLRGDRAADGLGQSLSAADHNGDGFSDVIIAVPGSATTQQQAAVLWGNDWLGDVVLLSGQVGADNIVGSAGNDTLTGNGGSDAFAAGAGDDRVEIADTEFFRVRGGTGEDTLALTGTNLFLDLSSLAPESINSIEVIDLGDANNHLKVSQNSILRLSPTTNTIRVTGGATDLFEGSAGDDWVVVDSVTLNGIEYTRYADGEAEMLVQASVIQPGVERLQSSQRFYFDTTASGADVATDVVQFPLLLRISDPDIIDAVQPGAPDIRFVDSDGTTRLPYEIERWDQANNEALVWVLVPQVDGNSSADFITLLYDGTVDGSVADGQDPAALWNDYVGVWHFAKAGSAQDSSPFANHGLDEGGVGRSESFVGRGASFTGDEAYRVPYAASLSADGGAFSVETWYTSNTCSTTILSRFDLSMLARGDGVSGFWEMRSAHYVASIIVIGTRVDRASFSLGAAGNDSELSGGSLFGLFFGDCAEHVVATYDPILGSSLYINGELKDSSGNRYSLESNGDLLIGGHGTSYRLTLDESRVARRLWSSDRAQLSYENQRQGSALIYTRP